MQCVGRNKAFAANATGGSRQACSRVKAVNVIARAIRQQPDHQEHHQEQQLLQDTTRRQLLGYSALLSAASSLSPSTAAAAAAPACELTASPSGLQFCDLKVGEGAEPVKGALIRCHYTGRLASNGRVFDSSYERGRPLTFKVGVHEVITGWDLGILGTEGVPAMKEGGKRLLLIPSDLAYGSRGAGGVIPPNAELEFEVELLGKRR